LIKEAGGGCVALWTSSPCATPAPSAASTPLAQHLKQLQCRREFLGHQCSGPALRGYWRQNAAPSSPSLTVAESPPTFVLFSIIPQRHGRADDARHWADRLIVVTRLEVNRAVLRSRLAASWVVAHLPNRIGRTSPPSPVRTIAHFNGRPRVEDQLAMRAIAADRVRCAHDIDEHGLGRENDWNAWSLACRPAAWRISDPAPVPRLHAESGRLPA